MTLKDYEWTHPLYKGQRPQALAAFSLDDAVDIAVWRLQLVGLPRRGLTVREATQAAGFA